MGEETKTDFEGLNKFLREECYSEHQFKIKSKTKLEALYQSLFQGRYLVEPIESGGSNSCDFKLKRNAFFVEYPLVNFHFEYGIICAERMDVKTHKDKELVKDLAAFLNRGEYKDRIFALETLVTKENGEK